MANSTRAARLGAEGLVDPTTADGHGVERWPVSPGSALANGALERIWSGRLEVLAAELAVDEDQRKEIRNAAHHFESDYHGRFLVELLQNANDQALRAGLPESSVLVALAPSQGKETPGLLAVGNQGRPFDESGIRSLASLALSDKNPEALLGNKGLGFKSVFEVSRAPEVFSVGHPAGTLATGAATRLGLSLDPLSNPFLRAALERLAADLLRLDGRRRLQIQERHRGAIPEAVLLRAVEESAPWRFPVPLEDCDLLTRAEQLGLGDRLGQLQTLVVLPLKDKQAEGSAAEAVERLLAQSDPALLFLDGVTTVVVLDRHGARCRTRSRSLVQFATAERGTTLDEVAIKAVDDQEPPTTRIWWRARRTMGDEAGIGAQEAERERELVNGSARGLPGDGWAKVQKATVAVALPMDLDEERLPQPDGRFCIGLPTEQATGSCFWVDAHFHGNASRKSVGLDLPYNALLLGEAEALVRRFVEALQTAATIEQRRMATLCLTRAGGPLADRMWGPGGIAHGKVVLGAEGISFIEGSGLRLPNPQAMGIFESVRPGADLAAAGFVLPDERLLQRARQLLVQLGAQVPAQRGDTRFTSRRPGGLSLLEQAATRLRDAGQGAWSAFLGAVLDEFEGQAELKGQRILPVGDGDLASPVSKVFLEPLRGVAGQPGEDAEVALEEIPASVLEALRLLDPRAVAQAEETARPALAKRLLDRDLVKAPRKRALVNDLLIPRLQASLKRPEDRGLALGLLELGFRWILSAPKATFDLAALRVPAAEADGSWTWKAPDDVYFGPGWLTAERDSRLEAAYGRRVAGRLVPWSRFREAAGTTDDAREWWQTAMREVGVQDCPAILTAGPIRAFWGRGELRIDFSTPCPIPGAAEWWHGYLTSVAQGRRTTVSSGQPYELEEVLWVDGLEDPDTRNAVFDLMLAEPETYADALQTTTRRPGGQGDAVPAASFWQHAITSLGWPIVPADGVEDRRVPVHEAWLLTKEQARRPFTALLAKVPARMRDARVLLGGLGVPAWEEAPPERLIREIHALAARPIQESDQPLVIHLAGELYEGLSGSGLQDIGPLLPKPVVLMSVRRQPEAVDLRKVERIFVNDDPVRAPFVPGFESGLQLPVGKRADRLVSLLRTRLGAERILRTSDAPPDVPFTPDGAERPLLEFLDQAYPRSLVVLELALLVAYSGTKEADPRKEDFQRNWARFKSLRLVSGRFESPHQAAIRSFYEEKDHLLYLASGLTPRAILQELWRVAGQSYQTAFIAYSAELEAGRARAFFAAQGLDERHQRLVEDAIGWGSAFRFDHLRSVLYAVWSHRHTEDVGAFEALWSRMPPTADEVAIALGAPGIGSTLDAATRLPEEEAALGVLPAAGVTVAAWQEARARLGLPPHAFKCSLDAYASAKGDLLASLTSEASHRRALDLDAHTATFQAIAAAPPPAGFDQDVQSADLALEAALDVALAALDGDAAAHPLATALAKVRALAPARRVVEVRGLGTQREADLYRRQTDDTRAEAARQVVDDVLTLAAALGAQRGEPVDRSAIAGERRVRQLSQGYWANKYSVLAALRDALEDAAPRTTQVMSEGNAFKVVTSLAELWRPHEGELGPREAPAAAPRLLKLLGVEVLESELAHDLARSENGLIGQALRSRVDPMLDLARLATGAREQLAEVSERVEGAGSRGEGAPGRKAPSRRKLQQILRDQQLHGQVGEAFVFEQFRAILPGFDFTCWRSEAADAYGFSAGEDGLGFDFCYLDTAGRLTGRTDQPECLIEVKSTTGDGRGPFVMTAHEWRVALDTHLAAAKGVGHALYLIVRVARVHEAPAIVDVIIDPVAEQAANRLRRYEQSVLVTVGSRLAP